MESYLQTGHLLMLQHFAGLTQLTTPLCWPVLLHPSCCWHLFELRLERHVLLLGNAAYVGRKTLVLLAQHVSSQKIDVVSLDQHHHGCLPG